MNNPRALIAFLALTFAVFSVVSCGGGMQASGGTGGTGMVARGTITATGGSRVAVAAVSYQTTAGTAMHFSNGTTSLKPGMVVTVRGSVDAAGTSGTATDITYARTVIGHILVGASAANGFTVYGQNITYHLPITFEDRSGNLVTKATGTDAVPAWVADNVPVEISGFVLADGTVDASYVRQLDSGALTPGEDMEFVGLVTDISHLPAYINVNGTEVNLPLSSPSVSVGEYVHLHAKVPADPTVEGVQATEIEVVDMELGGTDSDEGELEGVIANLSGDRMAFTVSGQTVQIVAGVTIYEYGTSASLADDVHVEVHGHFSGGQFLADKVEFE